MSTKIFARVTGGPEITQGLDKLKRDMIAKLQDVCTISAERVRARAVKKIMTQKPNPGAKPGRRGHIPSPPGGPPNTDTGNLTNHIEATTLAMNGGVASRVVANAKYALALEYGYAPRNLLPRPFLNPEFKSEEKAFRDACAKAGGQAVSEFKGGKK